MRFLNVLAEQLTGWTQADAIGRDGREVFQIVSKTLNPKDDVLELQGVLSLAQDVTERKWLEEHVRICFP